MKSNSLLRRTFPAITAVLLSLAFGTAGACAKSKCTKGDYTEDFRRGACTFDDTGRTSWFVLEPGYFLKLEGMEKNTLVEVTITVLDANQLVDGVNTRVIEERELVDGELVEVSRNYFAICEETGDVFYFGEDVDIYEGGVIVSHDGAWLSGQNGAQAGVLFPGTFLLGSRYFQEIAPGIALDRACNDAMGLTVVTPAGTFLDCVRVIETTPLEKGTSTKIWCPNIGLVDDDGALLVDWSEKP